jgi:hypothetical protein
MVAPAFDCNPNRLKELLDDGLSGSEQADVVRHLDGCESCQQKLEALAAEHVWWERLRFLPESVEPAKPPRAKPPRAKPPVRLPLREGQTADATVAADAAGEESDDGVFLDFLDPSGKPAHIGRLGPFEITELLGRGGMGIVFKATDRALNRPVAIKVLAPHFASSGAARKRFAREAKAAAAVVHDHVVAIHSVGTWKGLPYLVMSYVPGCSLQELLDAEGPLDVKEILRIGMQTALGLAAAHAQGLVHRDVKPANILLENGVRRVRITDFGLARAMDEASLTQSGVISGTPQYMSPEQSRSAAIDHRSDLFSLGSTLFAMAAGHPPFRADSPMTVLLRIRDEEPRPIRDINPDVPDWLATIIARLLAKAPERRFQSAAHVAELLEKCLAHVQQPGTNPLPPILKEPVGFWRRRARPMIAAALLFVMACAGAAAIDGGLFRGQAAGDAPQEPAAGLADTSPASVSQDRDMPLIAVDDIRRQAEQLDAELRRSSTPSASNDAGAPLLNEVRRRLDKLERELTLPRP